MSRGTQQEHITKKTIAYHTPGMDEVAIERDVEYGATDSGVLTMDIYYPSDSEDKALLPAVVFVTGFPDPGYQAMLGCMQKEMGSYMSWAKATATSGLAAITYTNRNPAEDIHTLLQYVREHGASLGIEPNRIGVWSCSGNVPNALSVLMRYGDTLKCAVLCYGYMLGLDGSTVIADAASKWGFVNPCSEKSVDDVPDFPLFIVRAGQDETPHLNDMLDRFLAKALDRNLPVSLLNHPAGPHAFDLMHDSEITRDIVRQILAFMQFHLLGYALPTT